MSTLPKATIRNKKNAPRQYVLYDSISPLMGINGPVVTKRIEDYPPEDQQRWANMKPKHGEKKPISSLEGRKKG